MDIKLTAYDIPVVTLWAATILVQLGLAGWAFWRARKVGAVILGTSSRVRSPLFVFAPAVFTAATPFVMRLMPTDGLNPMDFPHLLMPGACFALAAMILVQIWLSLRFVRYARSLRDHHSAMRSFFERSR